MSRLCTLKSIILLTLISCSLWMTTPLAKEAQETDRPRIGLVLGGGGAKGLAHLGVMKWLEEHRVPVDYLAGTSMGGLLGSLMAMGWTTDEIETMLDSLDWTRLMASSPPFEILSYRRKADTRQFPSQLELGLKNGLSVPGGLNPGHFIGLLFDRVTLPYSSLKNFDELPIPFRCVATDMENGLPVVMTDGDLTTALRATMAIPGVFNAVERDGQILADGGILDNLPADVVKEMGADFVIAVQVGSPLEDREQLQSLLGMVNQSITIMMLDNVRRSQKLSDIVLSPEIGKYGTLEFGRTSEIVEKGYEAAEQKRVLLESLSLEEGEWKEFLERKNSRRLDQYPSPSSLSVLGVDGDEQKALEKKGETHLGRLIVPEALENDLTSVYGSGRYYSVGYSVKDATSLLVQARKKGYGPPFVRFGFLVDGSEFDSVKFGIRSRFSFFDLGGFGSELLVDASLGTPLQIAGEYYRPLAHGWFIAPRGRASRRISDVFQEGERIAEYRMDYVGGGIDLGYGFGLQNDEIRIGHDFGHLSMETRIGQELPLPQDGTTSVSSIHYVHDGQDNAVIPRHGIRIEGAVDYFFESPGTNENLTQIEAKGSLFSPLTDKNSLFFRGAGGTSVQNDVPFQLQFSLGGPVRLGAYSREEIRGSRYFYASGGMMREIAELSLIVPSKAYIGGWYELGSAFDRNQYERLSHSVSAGIILESFFGPLFLGGSVGDGKRGKIYFLLGQLF